VSAIHTGKPLATSDSSIMHLYSHTISLEVEVMTLDGSYNI
jgi:hypothetical protein